jgi:lipopolysaccharide export system permease protein
VRLLTRYVLFEVLTFFSISLAAFTGLLITIKMLKLTSLIVNRGVDVGQIGTVLISIIPTFLEIALPMATLLGVMLAFARLCGDSEVIVMKASGVSLYHFVRPVGAFALTVLLAGLLVSNVLRPWGFRSLTNVLFDIARSKSTSGLTEGFFNKLGELTIYAERIDYTNGDLHHVLIDDKRDTTQRKVVIAKRGRVVADEATHSIVILLGEGVAHESGQGGYARTAFTSNSLSIDPAELKNQERKGLTFRELSSNDLDTSIATYREALASFTGPTVRLFNEELTEERLVRTYRKIRIEKAQRMSLPFAVIIMAFIGMSLGIMSPRTQRAWGAGFAGALGVIVFIAYYALYSVGLALADSGRFNISLALWIPNILGAAIAALLLHKLATERWHSVSEGLFANASRFVSKLRRVARKREVAA